MRFVLLSILMSSGFLLQAQINELDLSAYGVSNFPIDEATGFVTYSDVVDVDDVAANDLYEIALDWINNYYNNSSSVMKIKDKENGVLEGKHSFYVMKDMNGMQVKGDLIKYKFNIRVRDGRYKYTITKINVQKAAYYGIEEWINDEDKISDIDVQESLEQVNVFFMETYIPSMLEGIQPKKVVKEDAW